MTWLILLGLIWLVANAIMVGTIRRTFGQKFMESERSPFHIAAFCLTALLVSLVFLPFMIAPFWVAGFIDCIFFSGKLTEGAEFDKPGPCETWLHGIWQWFAELPGRLL